MSNRGRYAMLNKTFADPKMLAAALSLKQTEIRNGREDVFYRYESFARRNS